MPSGTTGTLELRFDVTGSWSESAPSGINSGNAGATASLGMRNLSTGAISNSSQLPPYQASLSTQFTFGSPLDFEISLIGGSVPFIDGLDFVSGTLSSSVDISNTALISAIVVKDNVGNIMPFQLFTESNAPIFSELVAVPVPPAIWLFGSGLLGLIGIARREKTA